METVQSVLSSIRQGYWMISLDLKDLFFQAPFIRTVEKFLRFVTSSGTLQFKVLCFGLTTAPRAFFGGYSG